MNVAENLRLIFNLHLSNREAMFFTLTGHDFIFFLKTRSNQKVMARYYTHDGLS